MPTQVPAHLRQALEESIARQGLALEGLSRAQVIALRPLLEEARRELASELGHWLSDVKDGGERWTAQHKRNALVHVNRAMRRLDELHPLAEKTEVTLRGTAERIGVHSVEQLERELALFEGTFRGSVHHVDLDIAATIAEGRRTLWPRYRTSSARYAGAVGEDIRKQIALGLVKNETIHQTMQRLIRHGGPRGLVALRGVVGDPGAKVEEITEGLFARYNFWAERLVRTETLHAYNLHHKLGIEDAAKDDDELRQRWDSTLDLRICPVCKGLNGEVVDVGALFRGIYEHPPAHPLCRCVLTPWKDRWGLPEPEELPELPPAPSAPQAAQEAKPEPRRRRKPKPKPKPKPAAPAPTPLEQFQAAETARAELEREVHGRFREADREYKKLVKRRRLTFAQLERMRALGIDRDRLRKVDPEAKARLTELEAKARKLRAKLTPEERGQVAAAEVARLRPTTGKDWSSARYQVDDDLIIDGFARRAADVNLDMVADNIDRGRGLLGEHYWQGAIRIDIGQAKIAKKFAANFATPAKARAARKALAEVGELGQELEDLVGEVNEALDKRKAGGNADLEGLQERLWALREKIEAHPGRELLDHSQGMATIVHESLHGFGPARSSAYWGPGKLVEEVTTEITSRAIMRTRYGIPDALLRRGGPYSWWSDALTDRIASIYQVDYHEARRRLEGASVAVKKTGRKVETEGDFVDVFTSQFPSEGRDALRKAVAEVTELEP